MMSSVTENRLVRVDDGWIAGVCGGVAQRVGLPPTLVRLAWLAAVLFFGTGLLLYAVLWWLMPSERDLPLEPTVWERGENGRRPPLERTARDRKIFGVCGGLARRANLDPTVVRLAALALAGLSFGTVVPLYVIAAVAMPGPRAPISTVPA
jgi:phage shock protein PspC (stress-responsive transcriptional regulator)